MAVPVPWYVTAQVRPTVPEKPLTPEIWRVSVAVPPGEEIVRDAAAGVTASPSPVPPRETVWGELPALSVSVRVPVAAPVVVGVNVMEMMQFAPTARDEPQLLVWANGPEMLVAEMVSGSCPVLVRMTIWAALVAPMAWAGKLSVPGAKTASGCGFATVMGTVTEVAAAKLVSPA